jgi:phosphocarrier protein
VNVAEGVVEVKNRLGLHLRAASALAQALKPFAASVTLTIDGHQANAKSVISLIMLGAAIGAKLKAKAEGDDAAEALATVRRLFEDRFGED